MTSSLVGSEMCIRDSPNLVGALDILNNYRRNYGIVMGFLPELVPSYIYVCLLYTSDAADDM
eukprot:32151-Prorocentrum_lima.AAC.1